MFEKIGYVFGYLKLFIYKIYYGRRLVFSGRVRFMPSCKIIIGKNGKLILGENFSCRTGVIFKVADGAVIDVGSNVFINYNSIIVSRERIEIGRDTIIASDVSMYDHNHLYGGEVKVMESGHKVNPIRIGSNVWIGANSLVLAGVTIGDNVVVAAGTVVNKNVSNNSLIYSKQEIVTQSI